MRFEIRVTYRQPSGSQRQQTYNANTLADAALIVAREHAKANVKLVETLALIDTRLKND